MIVQLLNYRPRKRLNWKPLIRFLCNHSTVLHFVAESTFEFKSI